MTTKTHDDATHVRALGQGINLTDIRKALPLDLAGSSSVAALQSARGSA